MSFEENEFTTVDESEVPEEIMEEGKFTTIETKDSKEVVEQDEFITVIETEGSEELEFPKEDNGNVLLKTLQTQFPDAIGLKYKGSTGKWRAIREIDDELVAPKKGWGDTLYYLTFPTRKRKGSLSTNVEEPERKVTKPINANGQEDGSKDVSNKDDSKVSNILLEDLAVVGLARTTTSNQLQKHLEEKYGTKLAYCNVKTDFRDDPFQTKGFGFVRFTEQSAAEAAIACSDDYLHGFNIQVRHRKAKRPVEMYVSGILPSVTENDLISYFNQFGQVKGAYIPKERKEGTSGGYGFFSMASRHVAEGLIGRSHIIHDKVVKVKFRINKGPTNTNSAVRPLIQNPVRPGGTPMGAFGYGNSGWGGHGYNYFMTR